MKAETAIIWFSTVLCAFYILLNFYPSAILTMVVYLSIPVFLILLVFIVLMDDSMDYPELGDEEWGYRDKDKEDLWII
jgi:branched-subunit amino acid permease